MLAAEGAQGALQATGTHLVGALHAHLQAGTELVLVISADTVGLHLLCTGAGLQLTKPTALGGDGHSHHHPVVQVMKPIKRGIWQCQASCHLLRAQTVNDPASNAAQGQQCRAAGAANIASSHTCKHPIQCVCG